MLRLPSVRVDTDVRTRGRREEEEEENVRWHRIYNYTYSDRCEMIDRTNAA